MCLQEGPGHGEHSFADMAPLMLLTSQVPFSPLTPASASQPRLSTRPILVWSLSFPYSFSFINFLISLSLSRLPSTPSGICPLPAVSGDIWCLQVGCLAAGLQMGILGLGYFSGKMRSEKGVGEKQGRPEEERQARTGP